MKSLVSLKHCLFVLFLGMVLLMFGGTLGPCQGHAANAYDLSEWQGRITNHQARHLKHEVNFVVLRAQDGSRRPDRQYQHDSKVMQRAHVPYGAYSFALYRNSKAARQEADNLYYQAPQAKFYVNDIEVNHAGRRLNSATKAWAREMKSLTTRPIVLYSYANFINSHLRRTVKHYNAVWVASYTNRQPLTNYHYDLWQYTDAHRSRALHRKVDASVMVGKHPLSFWIGNSNRKPKQRVVNVTSVK